MTNYISRVFLATSCFLGVSILSAATTGNVSFSSSTNALTADVGTPLTITADRAVTWSLAPGSVGSLTAISGTSVRYTPPASGVAAQNSIGGCMVLPNDSIFNTRIDKLPVASESAAWVGEMLSYGTTYLGFTPSWGVNLIDNTVPTTSASFLYQTLPNGTPFQFAPAPARKREMGSLTTDGANDHHMVSLNHQTCRFYESYQDGEVSGYSAESGYTYSSTSYSQPSGGATDAAGLPLTPLTLHVSEIESGAVKHALRFSACGGCIGNSYVWPAIFSTGYIGGNAAAPMGSRWRLKSSFEISGFSPMAQVVLRAIQQYGMILADIGTTNQLETSSDVNNDPEVVQALAEIASAQIISSDLEVVDESALQVSSNSHEAKPNGTAPVVDYAIVTARDANGNVLSFPIAVQPVLVGTLYNHMIFQAGQSVQLSSWVNGSSNQEVTWTASAGSVSSSGVYTPPSSVSSPEKVTLVGSAVADSSAKVQINGWLIPSGAIRIDIGDGSSYVDSQGKAWMADTLGFETGPFSQQNDSYPSNAWGNIANAPLYQTYVYTWGDDLTYGPFVVPNGTYSVNFYFGKGECSGAFNPSATWDNSLNGGPVVLEANGADTVYNIMAAENDTCRTPATGTITATVTNNLLTIALRSTGSSNVQSAPDLNALSIVGSSYSAATAFGSNNSTSAASRSEQ